MNALRKIWPFTPAATPALRVVGLTSDRRTQAQRNSYCAIEQERADIELEKQWRENVRLNALRRLERKLQAERPEDPESEFMSWQDEAADSAGAPRFGEI